MKKFQLKSAFRRAILGMAIGFSAFTPAVMAAQGQSAGNPDKVTLVAVNNNASVQETAVGTKMPDGTIYLGLSQGRDWFATAEDAKDNNGKTLFMTFNEAAKYTKSLKAHGHEDWMLPDGDMLKKMFAFGGEGAFKGTFSLPLPSFTADSGITDPGWYWSSKEIPEFPGLVWAMRFPTVGGGDWVNKSGSDRMQVRPVRGVLRP